MTDAPRSGLRHAARLLLTSRAKALASTTPGQDILPALAQLAHDLVALARDMRAGSESASWLLDEYGNTVGRLPNVLDQEEPLAVARAIISQVESFTYHADRRDVFLIHVPEDRIGAAARLAIEMTKRRLTVAMAEYEVISANDLEEAIDRGLRDHTAGLVVDSVDFQRRQLPVPGPHPRLRATRGDETEDSLDGLRRWIHSCRT